MLELEFMRLAFAVGAVVGVLAPAVGFFLVERRQSLVGDGLGHVAFAGVAAGLPARRRRRSSPRSASPWSARSRSSGSARAAARPATRRSRSCSTPGSRSASCSSRAPNRLDVGLFQYLFGSILTVTRDDLWVVLALGTVSLATIALLYRGLVGVVLDEEGSRVAGVHVGAAEHRGRRARGPDGRHLDADRRDPPDRGADGAPGERRATDRVEPPLDARPLDGDRRSGRSLAGLTVAYYGDLPPGGTIVLVAAGAFVAASLLGGLVRPR